MIRMPGMRFSLSAHTNASALVPPSHALTVRMVLDARSVGIASTPHGRIRVVMLAHCIVPRACPVLSPAELRSLAPAGTYERQPRRPNGKAKLWRRLLDTAYVLHCFPPGGDPLPGEKRFIFMGHERHTHAELMFARRQGLWRVASGDGAECRQ